MAISKIKVGNTEHELQTTISNVTGLQTALADKANKTEGVFFIEGTGTTDSTAKTSTWTGTSDRITSYYDGLTIKYKIGVAGQSTVTLNINSLGAKTVYRFNTTKLTTQFPVGSIISLTYHADLNSGCWITNDYDSNTNTYQRVYESSSNVEYPITTRYNTTDGSSYYAEYGRYTNGVTLNPSTNTITATKFKGDLTGNADTATKATQDGSGNVITSTYATKTALNTKLTANGWETSEGNLHYFDGFDYDIQFKNDRIVMSRDSNQTTSTLYFPEGKTGTIATTDDISSSNGTDTNTTYDLSASKNSTNGNAKINLTAGGSGSGTDSVTIKGTGGTTVTTDANGVVTINSPTSSSSGSTVSSEMPIISYTGTSYSYIDSRLDEGDTMYIHLKKIGGGAFQLGDRLELCALRKSVRSINEQNAGEVRWRLRALCIQDITQDIIDNADGDIAFAIVGGASTGANQLFCNDTSASPKGGSSIIHIRVRRPIYAENGKQYNAKFSNLITLEKTYSTETMMMKIK